ncbi:MAG: T9SS type A sorting domain-containing protein [Bacteroidota bacterium]
MKKLCLCITLTAIFALGQIQAQEELPRRYESYLWNSSTQAFTDDGKMSHNIHIEGATWLRLHFGDTRLPKGIKVIISSKLDGSTQILDASEMARWNGTSAYFNGDEITVTIERTNSRKVNLSIEKLEIGEPIAAAVDIFSQCGSTDNRVSSNNPAIGRIVPIGCTGWIIRNGKMVTAGHCVSSSAQVLEFNVPQSNSNRSIVHPPIQFQFPINQSSFVTQFNGSPDTDWAVFETGTNSQGQTAINAQGSSFDVVRSNPGNSITITGFGTDSGSDNQTQQTHTGPLTGVTNTRVSYQADTEGGNSGSPIIDTSTGNAVGVHAYGGCRTNGSGSNFGARATITAFWNAMGLDDSNPPGGGDCGTIDFNNFTISSFSNQDVSGNFQLLSGGGTLRLDNNTWKSINLDYNITSSTVIEFDFGSTSQGEIHGIALENDNSLTSARVFKLYGTQNYGVTNFDNYNSLNSYASFTIPVGSFYTGPANRLVFINDNDAGSNNTSFFRNVRVYEPASCSSVSADRIANARTSEQSVIPVLGTEDEVSIQLFPNPVHDILTINLSGMGEASIADLINISGQKVARFDVKNGTNSFQLDNIPSGMYLLKIGDGESAISKKILIK